jgi:hypothetical protein
MTRLVLVMLALVIVVGVGAQTPPASSPPTLESPPVLAEVDRLKLVNALQAIDLASLRLQVAATDLQRVRADADALITRLSVPGWQLNDKLEYVRAPKKEGGS